jgi:YegS/Rv2252/BmrU family lipid kinase
LSKKKIGFIINPKSGTKNKANLPLLIKNLIDETKFNFEIKLTEYAGHAILLAKEMAALNFDIVVIAGGDGSINEVSSALVNTQTALGILPMGSGNGLSRHLALPLNIEAAIKKINSGNKSLIDTCLINDEIFVSASGVGFDGLIAHEFSKVKKRGIAKYITISAKKFFGYKPQSYSICVDGKQIETKAFMVVFANSQQFGSGLKIAPKADLCDGLMHCCILKPFGIISGAKLLYEGFSGQLKANANYELIDCKMATIKFNNENSLWQKDGEPMHYVNEVVVKINPKSLWVWI